MDVSTLPLSVAYGRIDRARRWCATDNWGRGLDSNREAIGKAPHRRASAGPTRVDSANPALQVQSSLCGLRRIDRRREIDRNRPRCATSNA
jgi:hypothetical protein